ncbi:helix-turn-helix transcriptional regulator [Endozoicomonas sp. ISHI1]|uniref:helix-turn-helix domain-containing protein n=1 Tax=Endozoicomonas sp. ISHI1 TaxID=2825882 RepID=UPI002148A8A1|nr:helix-turn-helix transcriptional regulator [Endozoicomonas sp. ISHI1]
MEDMIILSGSNNEDFSKDLRENRKKLGLSQEELADAAKISKVMVGRYERGIARPSEGTWQMLRKALEDRFFQIAPRPKPEDVLLSEANTDQLCQRLKELGWGSIKLE